MSCRFVLWGIIGVVAALAAVPAAWILSLPPNPPTKAAPLVPAQETESTLAALKPPKRERPLVAIIGINDATETTDYLMPYGILHRADVADVMTLATEPGPVALYPALKVEPNATIADFDAQNPGGADYVIVPAMSRDDDPKAMAWLKAQAAKGAIIIAVCAGAKAFLDLPRTLEYLETVGVPVLGWRHDDFPAFYTRSSGLPVPHRVEAAAEVADVLRWRSRDRSGVLVAVPIPVEDELAPEPSVQQSTSALGQGRDLDRIPLGGRRHGVVLRRQHP